VKQHQKSQGARKGQKTLQQLQHKRKSQGNKERKKDTMCIQCIVESCKGRRKVVFHIQASSQNVKVESHKERKKDVHFALKFHRKILNPKVESCKEQVEKENFYAL
jgi:hypothetical protein